ncbi:acetate--CoA ligase family protein [Mesobacterium sp. TK19101]|uniref:Acetate--CoA ligase family protein n=1 Tax=Mesobacterium hydrothermale TaxID=3111907 RepID=A0ABU6HE55_9RHOB|nr:acetate--CoA ligase family protein [Mesobacterium sp. TK19101]MEC3860591.1 acetate--CoA ligase family protein [Mesobacterium sp. TK19101]
MERLERLLKPRSVAVIGGGAWCRAVVRGLRNMGYAWDVWPVHPTAEAIEGVRARRSLSMLPEAPDAAFVGVNRDATIDVVRELSRIGAGGAVCFASGFSETTDGQELNAALLDAAGAMPVIGPNCYGFINAVERAALWPDIHGLVKVDRGVAILTQSSNIALNMSMQRRGLPIAYLASAGNQAQTSLAELATAFLEDPCVTALGLHIEGIGDLRGFEDMARVARSSGKSVVVLKTGRSDAAQAAAVSHTASISGSDAGADALFKRLGMARVNSLDVMLEALKLLHFAGPLPVGEIASMSCSGGEASLMADAAAAQGLRFAELSPAQRKELEHVLGPRVTVSNPLDYHTYIWGNTQAMADTFAAMMKGRAVLSCLIADFPRSDRCQTDAWECLIEAAAQAKKTVGLPLAVVSSIADTMPEDIVDRLVGHGLIPMAELENATRAIRVVTELGRPLRHPAAVMVPRAVPGVALLAEAEAKRALSHQGVDIPFGALADTPEEAGTLAEGRGPVVLKAQGIAHKTEAGAVALGLTTPGAVADAARTMPGGPFLVEEMIDGAVAELLVGVVADPAHGYVLTLAQGGILAELAADSAKLLLPVDRSALRGALSTLRIWPVLMGYRGRPGADPEKIIDAIMAIQSYVQDMGGAVQELEINPLIVTPTRAVAVDALVRTAPRIVPDWQKEFHS